MDDVETIQREADKKKKSAEQMIIDNGRETSKVIQAAATLESLHKRHKTGEMKQSHSTKEVLLKSNQQEMKTKHRQPTKARPLPLFMAKARQRRRETGEAALPPPPPFPSRDPSER